MKKQILIFALMLMSVWCKAQQFNPQNPSWSQPPYRINFNLGTPVVSTFFGTSVTSEYAHNVAQDLNGNILFYIVDGTIYHSSGNIIDVFQYEVAPATYEPVTGATEYLIVPVPGNCTQYYLIAAAYTSTGASGNPMPYYIKIDVSVPNSNNPLYLGELYDKWGNATNVGDPLDTYFNFSVHHGTLHLGATPPTNTAGDRYLFISSTVDLWRYKITGNGSTSAISYDGIYDYTSFGYSPNGSSSTRSELEIYTNPDNTQNNFNAGGFLLAFPFDATPPGGGTLLTRIFIATLDNLGVIVGAPKIIDFPSVNNKVKGLEFSPRGEFLYVTNSELPYIQYIETGAVAPTLQTLSVPNASDFQNSHIEWAHNGYLYIGAGSRMAAITSPNTPLSPGWVDPALNFSTPLTVSYAGNLSPLGVVLMPDQIDGEIYGVTIPSQNITIAGNEVLCSGTSNTLTAPAGYAGYLWSTGATTASITVSTPGTYTVVVTDASGCQGKKSITLTQIDCCNNGNFVITGNYKVSQLLATGCPYVSLFNPSTIKVNTGFTTLGGTNNIVAFNGTLTVDMNLLFENCELILGGGSKIILDGYPVNITFTSKNYLHNCGNKMWEGIIDNHNVIADGTGDTWIEDAETALECGFYGNFDLQKVHFNRNWVDLVINANNISPNPGKVYNNCTFTCQNLISGLPDVCIAPHAGERTLYGAVVNYTSTEIGDASFQPNIFNNLQNGIYANNSSVTSKNNRFQNISGPSIPGIPNGHCIFADAQGDNTLNLVVGGTTQNEYNVFENSSSGIFARNGMNVDAQRNYFTNASTSGGISSRVVNGNNNTIFFKDNYYNGFGTGIYLRDISGSDVTVETNKFNLGITVGTYAINFWNTLPPLQANTTHISGNTIKNINRSGIWMINNHFAAIDNINAVTFENLPPDPANNNNQTKWGIKLQNASQNRINQNLVERTGTDPTSAFDDKRFGISIETSHRNVISNNELNKLGSSIRFLNTLRNNVNCNYMYHNRIGVRLESSNIGDQPYTNASNSQDNQWVDYPSNSWDVLGLGTTFVTDWFSSSPNYPWTPNPFNVLPNSPQTYFFPFTPSASTCNLPCIDCRQRELAAIVREEGNFNALTEEEQYNAKRYVYVELRGDSTLMYMNTDNDSILRVFYEDTRTSPLGQFVEAGIILRTDTAAAHVIVSTVSPDNNAEWNERAVYQIYLETIARGIYEFSTEQYEILYTIAIQDPITGGTAVYSARVMLDLDVDDFITEQGGRYSYDNNSHHSFKDVATARKLIIKPNPAKESANMFFPVKEKENGLIKLFDLFGKEVLLFNIGFENNSVNMSTEKLNAGIYLARAYIDEALVSTVKFVIIK